MSQRGIIGVANSAILQQQRWLVPATRHQHTLHQLRQWKMSPDIVKCPQVGME